MRQISRWSRNDDNFESEFSYRVKAAMSPSANGERDTVTKFNPKSESFKAQDPYEIHDYKTDIGIKKTWHF